MAITKIDYTSKDFDSIRSSLIDYCRAKFPQWSDFFDSNNAVAILEMFAYVGDILCYYMDLYANEAFIDRAQIRKNLVSLSKLIGYSVVNAKAATVTLRFTLKQTNPYNVIIPVRTKCKTVDGVIFETQERGIIRSGYLTVDVSAKQCETFEESFIAQGIENESFELANSPFLDDGSITVTVGTDSWKEVDNFLDSGPSSKHFKVEINDRNIATVYFGDGINGSKLTPGVQVTITYQTGGGSAGNVGPGTINTIIGSIKNVFGTTVQISVTNPQGATGGEDAETNDEIRFHAPASLRATNRCVSLEDYESNAMLVAGVERAKALTVNEWDVIPENTVYVYIAPVGGGTASGSLLNSVLNELEYVKPKTVTVDLYVVSALYKTIDIQANVRREEFYTEEEVESTITESLTKFFSLSERDEEGNFIRTAGETIRLSQIIATIQDSVGVEYVELISPTADVQCAPNEFPALGEVTIGWLNA